MPAHITFPAIDAHHATGFSSHWLKTILREEFKFEGIIISDCLGMTGADIGSLLERSVQALEAGCNLLIAANQPRNLLLDCLNQLPAHAHQENMGYIEQFKQSMLRFTEPGKAQSLRALSQFQPEDVEISNSSDININPTKTI